MPAVFKEGCHQDDEYYHLPAPGLRKKNGRPPNLNKERQEVVFPVSYRYNGGIVVNGTWCRGFKVPPPIVPEGFRLVEVWCGFEMNAYPPYATKLLVREHT